MDELVSNRVRELMSNPKTRFRLIDAYLSRRSKDSPPTADKADGRGRDAREGAERGAKKTQG